MISEQKRAVLELFRQGRRLYQLRKFAEAREVFARALEVDKSDGPSREYCRRCDEYVARPPSEDWDGVYRMETK